MLENKERFNEIAIVVVDYAMPGMNGVELSRQLKTINPLLKIILLTGEADEHLAIQAFNDSVIDQYIRKPIKSNQQLLIPIIHLQNKYFFELSQSLLGKIETTFTKELKWLHDPVIIELFNNILRDKNIVEYYILDLYCNFILIDAKGIAFWLALADEVEMKRLQDDILPAVQTEEKLKEKEAICAQYGIAYREPKTPDEVINGIKDRKMIPFFFTDEEMETPTWEWKPYLHPANKIEDQRVYYYALICQPSIYQWPPKNFESYRHFLAQQC